MKKTLIFTLAFLLTGFATFAQDASKLAKKASRDLNTYGLDTKSNKDKLASAIEKIDEAFKLEPANATVLLERGNIYKTIAMEQATMLSLEQDVELGDQNAALIAHESYAKYFDMAEKKWQRKKALEGISAVQGIINTIGADFYANKKYVLAFESFKGQLASHDLLKANGKESALDDVAQYENQVYITALAAMLNNDFDGAFPYLEELYKTGNAQAAVYQGLYQGLSAKGDTEAATKYLDEGREKYPDDTGLLFDQINEYLKAGKMDELIVRLNTAIDKEPDNVSLYSTLASVYDNLYTKSNEAGETAKATEYFALAKNTYETAIEKNPTSADAYYGLGTLYYNKAALKSQELTELSADYSSAGQKKYEAAEKAMLEFFNQALPHFKKAENLNPNDQNTLIALKEILARTNDFEGSKAFKERLEKIQGGGTIDAPFYKE